MKKYSSLRFIIFSAILFLIIIAVSSSAFLFSMRHIIRNNKGNELSKMLEIERIKLESFVNSKIAVVMKMAESPLIIRYFMKPAESELANIALEEIDSYRKAFAGSIFWINDIDKLFYLNDTEPYKVDPELPVNYWYKMTLYNTKTYNFNINYNPDLKVTKLWINVPVFDEHGKPIGMLGTGIDLTEFIMELYKEHSNNVQLYFFNSTGEITGSRDVIQVMAKEHVDKIFGDGFLDSTLANKPQKTYAFDSKFGKTVVGTVPALEWYSVAIAPNSIDDYKNPMAAVFILMLVIMALIIIVFNIFINFYLKSLQKTMNSLEATSKYKSKFLAIMSHEIRTPINSIIGVTQIELQKEDLPDQYAGAFRRIHSSGSNLLGIINDILDMSKIEMGKMELNITEYSIANLINDAIMLNIVRIGPKPIKFEVDIKETLPAKLCGDELRLKQILNNLLSNAIKYTKKGFVKLSVSHSINRDGSLLLHFVIEDSGQGIKPEDQANLFSEYMRINTSANRTTEGTGLGLSITRKLVYLMDGTIEVKSEYNKGSAFTVTVKQKAIECEAIGKEIVEHLRNFTFSDSKSNAKVFFARKSMPHGSTLIVDDVETNLHVAKGLLAPYKLKIEMANSGFAAINKVEEAIRSGSPYDLVFMDHMMPEMDGMETTKRIRKSGYDLPIIALTANAISGAKEMFLENGFNDFLSKPIDAVELNAILEKWIPLEKQEEASKDIVGKNEPEKANAELLAIFHKDCINRIKEINKCLENEDYRLYTIQVHSLKSASANIGAAKISEFAGLLEDASKRGDTEFIKLHSTKFLADLQELLGDIGMNIKEKQKGDPSTEVLLKLKEALIALDIDAIDEIANDLRKFTTAEGILQNVLMGNYDEATAMIDNFLNLNQKGEDI